MEKKRPINQQLQELKNLVPLTSPMNLTVSVGNACNFRCVYCLQRFNEREDTVFLSMEDYNHILDNLLEFDSPLSQIALVSTGETLLHPELPQMIEMAKKRGVAKKVKIITNGSLLTPEYSDKLISAGIDQIKISLQGLNGEDYKKVCGVDFDFDSFYNHLSYLYKHKGNCQIHLKIIDTALNRPEEEFYSLFEDMSDTLFVEHCLDGVNFNENKYFGRAFNADICPMIFYAPFIDEKLNVFPCCAVNGDVKTPFPVFGNLKTTSLKALWNGSFRKAWIDLLKGTTPDNHICYRCQRYKSLIREEDIIDEKKDDILKKIECL